MTDKQERDERPDAVLVRPYISDKPGGRTADAPTGEIPAASPEPVVSAPFWAARSPGSPAPDADTSHAGASSDGVFPGGSGGRSTSDGVGGSGSGSGVSGSGSGVSGSGSGGSGGGSGVGGSGAGSVRRSGAQDGGAGAGRPVTAQRQRLLVLSGIAVLGLVVAGAVVLATGGGDDSPVTSAPRAPLTALPPGAPDSPAPADDNAGPGGSAVGSSARVSRSAPAPAASGSAGFTVPVPGGAGAPAASAPGQAAPPPAQEQQPDGPDASAAPPAPTLSPVPEAALTGPVTSGSSQRCLALGTLLGLDNSPIQTSGCSGVSYQRFTLGTDGTLRVANRCAAASGTEVRTAGCGDADAGQWRKGPGGTLVNLATGGCLTDPGASGAVARVEPCTGAANQVWTLP